MSKMPCFTNFSLAARDAETQLHKRGKQTSFSASVPLVAISHRTQLAWHVAACCWYDFDATHRFRIARNAAARVRPLQATDS